MSLSKLNLSGLGALMCAALLLACGSDAKTAGSGTGSSGGQGGSGGGPSTSATGGTGGFNPGSGGNETCNPALAYFNMSIDGTPVPHGEVSTLLFAPGVSFYFCYSLVPGTTDPPCDIDFSIFPEGELLIDQPGPASAGSQDAGWSTAPGGLTLTPFTFSPTFGATFTGTANDGQEDFVIEGTFEGCPLVTE